jgi:hypothetical protein
MCVKNANCVVGTTDYYPVTIRTVGNARYSGRRCYDAKAFCAGLGVQNNNPQFIPRLIASDDRFGVWCEG